jgi:hypothetical protein
MSLNSKHREKCRQLAEFAIVDSRMCSAITDEHIVVLRCLLNGNRDHQVAPDPENPSQEADRKYISGPQFLEINDLTPHDTTLWRVRSFGAWIANGEYIHLSNVRVDNGSPVEPDNSTGTAARTITGGGASKGNSATIAVEEVCHT